MKDSKRVKLYPDEVKALETWLAICECHIGIDGDSEYPNLEYWIPQCETAHKYWMSTIDGKASPTVKAYIDLLVDMFGDWIDVSYPDMDIAWYAIPFVRCYADALLEDVYPHSV